MDGDAIAGVDRVCDRGVYACGPPDLMKQAADATLPEALLQELARHGETRTWETGTQVVTQGEPAQARYIVHEGQLRVFLDGEGERHVELNTLGPGQYFGELLLGSSVRTASVQALTRVRLTKVGRAEFEQVIAERPDLALHVIQQLVDRVRLLSMSVRDMATLDVYGRLVALLESLAVEEGGIRCVPGPLSQRRIAERVGASRAMVHRLLHDLESGGYIALDRTRIVLHQQLPRRW